MPMGSIIYFEPAEDWFLRFDAAVWSSLVATVFTLPTLPFTTSLFSAGAVVPISDIR